MAATDTYTYDALGRVSADVNPLGSFAYTYLGQTEQVTAQSLKKGFAIGYLYESNQGDRRLKAIVPSLPILGAAVHFYRTGPEDRVLAHGQWPGQYARYTYDDADRLVSARGWFGEAAGQFLVARSWGDNWEQYWSDLIAKAGSLANQGYDYTYDAADNLTDVKTPSEAWSATVNADNQYQTAQGAAWTYDAAGNLTDDGQRSYAWDAAQRLIRVTDKTSGQVSTFAYDGLSRLSVRQEYASATTTTASAEAHYLWCGD